MSLDLLHRLGVDQRALRHALHETVADLQPADRLREFSDEGIVDLVLHVEPVGADAGLTHVAEFREHRALDRGVDVGVVEDDERRVAAELEPDLLHRRGGLPHQQFADFRRAGEADETHGGVLAQDLADRRGVARYDVEHARRQPRPQGQRAERQSGERGFRRRLDDGGAADGERRRDLAGDHRRRKIPRRDRGDDADRLAKGDEAGIGAMRGQHLAVNAFGFLGVEFNERGRVVDLAARFGERLALLAGHDHRDRLAFGDDEIEPPTQDRGALLGGLARPGAERALGRLDGPRRLRGAEAGDARQQGARRRIVNGIDAVADPHAVDQALAFQEGRIQRFHERPRRRPSAANTAFYFTGGVHTTY